MIGSTRRWVFVLAAALLVGAGLAFTLRTPLVCDSEFLARDAKHSAEVATQSPVSAPLPTGAPGKGNDAPRAPESEQSHWCRWGGALNSAARDGAGFFDERLAAKFFSEIQQQSAALSKYVMRLHSRAVLPEKPDLDAVFAPDAAGEHSVYLQFKEHPTPEQRAQLAQAGIKLESYVTAYAWTASGTRESFARVAQWDLVRGIAAIDSRDKLHASVFRGNVPDFAAVDADHARIWVLARPGTSAEAFSAALKRAPETAAVEPRLAYNSSLGPQFEVAAAPKLAQAIGALEEVAYVEYCPPPARSRDATTDSQHNINDVRDAGPGLTGSGVTVAIREIGQPEAHVAFASRTTFLQFGQTSPSSERDHATGVTGLVGGDGTSAPKGVAPACSLLIYAVNDDSNTFGTGDVSDAASRGARISNHSYGPNSDLGFGEYRTISADWDNAIRTNNLVGFFANYEASPSPGTKTTDYFVGAKNTICVNSSDSSANAGDLSPPTPPSPGISFFDGQGTMNDGRVKPDLTAFGNNVNLCQGTSSSKFNTGTSFSTPTCTGAAALIFQHYKNATGSEPSAALTKALMCNSATDFGNTGPDIQYGFGLLNVEAAIQIIDQRQSASVGPFVEGSLANGQQFQFTANVTSSPQLKATLCWMDVGGNPSVSSPALVNDLDLEVTGPDGTTTYFPYSLSAADPTAPATNNAKNSVDPIEQIIINTPTDGIYTFTVRGASVPSGPQPFAVVLNQSTLPLPLSAQILASPTEGPAPLSVAFSATGSTGNIVGYDWNFGDGASGSGVNVSHTYTAPGTYTATLTITDLTGKQASGSKTILVTRPTVDVFASRMQLKLNFSRPGRDSLTMSLTVPQLVMTSQQFRDAQKSGQLANQTLTLFINGTNVISFKTDARGRSKSGTSTLTQTLTKGLITVQLRNTDLQPIFAPLGMTTDPGSTGVKEVPVQLEAPDAIYRATFKPFYFNRNGRSGTAKQ